MPTNVSGKFVVATVLSSSVVIIKSTEDIPELIVTREKIMGCCLAYAHAIVDMP